LKNYLFYLLFPLFFLFLQGYGTNAVKPGKLVAEPPTLICLGFEWPISGDENRNASVAVEYRKAGRKKWRPALPLLRMGGERVYNRAVGLDYACPPLFAGSIFDLKPGTAYECRFTMKDPDGVQGPAVRKLSVRTRREPAAYRKGRVLHVYPPGFKGKKKKPAFTGLKAAYCRAGGGDWDVLSEKKVRPGDIIEVHAGLYKSDRFRYNDPLGIPFHGTYVLTAKGTPGKPVVIRGAGDGDAVFDGAGCYRLFDVSAADYHIFENLTFRNCDIAFFAGLKDVIGSSGLAVKNCRFENVAMGVTTQYAGSRDFYIADNTFIGREDPSVLKGWYPPEDNPGKKLVSYYAVKVYGQGHVVCHNRISRFHDGICVCTHGSPDPALKCVSIDFHNNDISHVADDFIEADGGVHNIRVFRNRCFNDFVRNIVYHVPWGVAFKFKAQPAGVLVYHNTVCAENTNTARMSNVHFRNNLFLGTDHPERQIWHLCTNTAYSTMDYNGFRPNKNGVPQFQYKAPLKGKRFDYDLKKLDTRLYKDLAEFHKGTGHEAHGRVVDYNVFKKAAMPDFSKPGKIYSPDGFDFSLKPDSRAVDAGCALPNLNDGHAGKGPDLGALESGRPVPVYGPRTQKSNQGR
jgi:hypothetical protein